MSTKRQTAAILANLIRDEIPRRELRAKLPPGQTRDKVNGRSRNNVSEALRTCLRDFDRDGLVKRDGDLVIVVDRDGLHAVATTPDTAPEPT